MKQKLEQGISLVVDRYAFSGVAFTSAKPVSATVTPIQGGNIVFIYKVCSCTLLFKRLESIRFEINECHVTIKIFVIIFIN